MTGPRQATADSEGDTALLPGDIVCLLRPNFDNSTQIFRVMLLWFLARGQLSLALATWKGFGGGTKSQPRLRVASPLPIELPDYARAVLAAAQRAPAGMIYDAVIAFRSADNLGRTLVDISGKAQEDISSRLVERGFLIGATKSYGFISLPRYRRTSAGEALARQARDAPLQHMDVLQVPGISGHEIAALTYSFGGPGWYTAEIERHIRFIWRTIEPQGP